MFTKMRAVAALATLAWSLALIWPTGHAAAAPAQQTGPTTWTVIAGQAIHTQPGPYSTWMSMRFYPETLTIDAGDSVVWKANGGLEPHTITFLGPDKLPDFVVPQPQPNGPPKLRFNPLFILPAGPASYDGSAFVNSGAMGTGMPNPMQYQLTFPKPGTYEYVCQFHGGQLPTGQLIGMTGKIVVQPAGTPYPQTPAQVDAVAQAQMAMDVQMSKDAEGAIAGQPAATSPGPNGTTIYHVLADIPSADGMLMYMRFAPEHLTIHVGDTVEWSSTDPSSFHTVTFGGTPETFLFEPQASGPPNVYFNPLVALPQGGATYDGTGYVNSGVIVGPGAPPSAGVQSYSLTFTKAGTYKYACAIHDEQGMIGDITVLAAGSAPGMPSTGQAGTLWLGWLLVGLLLAANGVLLVRRSRRAA